MKISYSINVDDLKAYEIHLYNNSNVYQKEAAKSRKIFLGAFVIFLILELSLSGGIEHFYPTLVVLAIFLGSAIFMKQMVIWGTGRLLAKLSKIKNGIGLLGPCELELFNDFLRFKNENFIQDLAYGTVRSLEDSGRGYIYILYGCQSVIPLNLRAFSSDTDKHAFTSFLDQQVRAYHGGMLA